MSQKRKPYMTISVKLSVYEQLEAMAAELNLSVPKTVAHVVENHTGNGRAATAKTLECPECGSNQIRRPNAKLRCRNCAAIFRLRNTEYDS
jgi:predicted RNA-binding Zn-ribbon protein involved in translation (DUF1610 family)